MDLSIARSNLAVLIDAENVPAAHAPSLFERIAALGDARLRRVYGDFSGTALSAWKAAAHAYALTPQHCVAQAAGKNGADIALAIDAMDLLHERLFDAFCLVSSDSDFTRLALRLRERGVRVHGFGEAKTLESFRAACDRFHVLGTAVQLSPAPTASPPARPTSTSQLASLPRPSTPQSTEVRVASGAMPFIEKALAASRIDCDGWVFLGDLGSQLSKDPAFRLKEFGFSQLSKLVCQIKAIETRKRANGGHDVRLRKNV